MIVLRLAVGLILFLFCGYLLGVNSYLNATSYPTSFPIIKGKTLAGKRMTFPRDYAGKQVFVLLGFQEHHKSEAEGWIDFFESRFFDYDTIRYFAVPMIGPSFLNFVKYQVIRKNVLDRRYPHVLVYPKCLSRILKSLSVNGKNDLLLYLLNKSGQIIWSDQGRITPDKQFGFLSHVDPVGDGRDVQSASLGLKVVVPTANEISDEIIIPDATTPEVTSPNML